MAGGNSSCCHHHSSSLDSNMVEDGEGKHSTNQSLLCSHPLLDARQDREGVRCSMAVGPLSSKLCCSCPCHTSRPCCLLVQPCTSSALHFVVLIRCGEAHAATHCLASGGVLPRCSAALHHGQQCADAWRRFLGTPLARPGGTRQGGAGGRERNMARAVAAAGTATTTAASVAATTNEAPPMPQA